MIGVLPSSIKVGDKEYEILNTDFRTALVILTAFNDSNISNQEKLAVMIEGLIGWQNISLDMSESEIQELVSECVKYLDGGKEYSTKPTQPKLMDWEQDEQLIFSAVNNVAGKELRETPYCHWWTFLGFFNEIHEGLFSNVIGIRQKKAGHKKLDDVDKEFYRNNKDLIDLRENLTEEEKEYKEKLNELFK